MTVTWTMIVSWLALQLPLAIFVGKFIKQGMQEPARRPLAFPHLVIVRG